MHAQPSGQMQIDIPTFKSKCKRLPSPLNKCKSIFRPSKASANACPAPVTSANRYSDLQSKCKCMPRPLDKCKSIFRPSKASANVCPAL